MNTKGTENIDWSTTQTVARPDATAPVSTLAKAQLDPYIYSAHQMRGEAFARLGRRVGAWLSSRFTTSKEATDDRLHRLGLNGGQ